VGDQAFTYLGITTWSDDHALQALPLLLAEGIEFTAPVRTLSRGSGAILHPGCSFRSELYTGTGAV